MFWKIDMLIIIDNMSLKSLVVIGNHNERLFVIKLDII